MINFNLQFACEIKSKPFKISVSKKLLNLRSSDTEIQFELSLQLQLQWLFYGDEVIGFKIENLEVEGETDDMAKLKSFLGGLTMFKDVNKFYSQQETLFSNENNQTKIKKLQCLRNLKVFACKSFSKNQRPRYEILDEIQLLLDLKELNLVPKIYEVYESNSFVYLIMEFCYRKFDNDFTDEEFKIIIYSLLQSLQQLQKLRIAHKRITRSHIVFDNENRVKLIGFRKASVGKVTNYEFELDIFKVGSLFYKFYLYRISSRLEQIPYIPDNGNDFLQKMLDRSLNYNDLVAKALIHPYFSSLLGEGLQIQLCELKPKFKEMIEGKFVKEGQCVNNLDHQNVQPTISSLPQAITYQK